MLRRKTDLGECPTFAGGSPNSPAPLEKLAFDGFRTGECPFKQHSPTGLAKLTFAART